MDALPETEVADEINTEQTEHQLPVDLANCEYPATLVQLQHPAS